MTIKWSRWSMPLMLALCLLLIGISNRAATQTLPTSPARQIIVPGEDRFTPFAITIRVGQTVEWVNNDTDDHTVVSNDQFNTAGHRGAMAVLKANGGTLRLTFNHPGTFPFYCAFHSKLDADHQPIAPGPDGGIQDPNGNFGTPMNGVITVVEDQ